MKDWEEGLALPLGLALVIYFIIEAVKAGIMIVSIVIGIILLLGMLLVLLLIPLPWLMEKPEGMGIKDYLKYDVSKQHPIVIALAIIWISGITWFLLFQLSFTYSVFDYTTWIAIKPILSAILITFLSFLYIYIRILYDRIPEKRALGEKFSCFICGHRSQQPLVGARTRRLDWNTPGDLYQCGTCNRWACRKHLRPCLFCGELVCEGEEHYHSPGIR